MTDFSFLDGQIKGAQEQYARGTRTRQEEVLNLAGIGADEGAEVVNAILSDEQYAQYESQMRGIMKKFSKAYSNPDGGDRAQATIRDREYGPLMEKMHVRIQTLAHSMGAGASADALEGALRDTIMFDAQREAVAQTAGRGRN